MLKVLFQAILLGLFLGKSVVVWAGNQTPVSLPDMRIGDDTKGRAWQAPDYSSQQDRLGYTSKSFQVPPGLRTQVNFWMEIYSKYSSDQGVFHDSDHIDIIYEVVNFPKLLSGPQAAQIMRRREQIAKAAKKRVENQLRRLQAHLDKGAGPAQLSPQDLRVWRQFEKVKGRQKFRQALGKDRLRMQLGQKDRFELGVFYSGRYIERIEKIFEQQGLPKELTRLPLVESSFNIFAISKVGASGIWQFMRSAARPYLKIKYYMDERNDPIKASKAAAKMLRANYKMLKSWPLAVTGYNYGPSGMRRLSRKLGSRDLVELIRRSKHRRFGFASKNFYASFLAALEVEKRADQYFSQPRLALPLAMESYQLPKPITWTSLVKLFGGSSTQARLYNPFLAKGIRRGYMPLPKGARIYLARGTRQRAQRIVASLPPAPKAEKYRVRRGDTLWHIARRFDVPLKSLMSLNQIRSGRSLRVGRTLHIPD